MGTDYRHQDKGTLAPGTNESGEKLVRENKGHMFSNIGVTFINVQEATSIVFLPLHLIQTNNHSSEMVLKHFLNNLHRFTMVIEVDLEVGGKQHNLMKISLKPCTSSGSPGRYPERQIVSRVV